MLEVMTCAALLREREHCWQDEMWTRLAAIERELAKR
jgi:hypothetical protein